MRAAVPVYVVAARMMAFASLQRPAFEAATPRIVPRAQLTAAAAIMSLSVNASVLIGSSLGGVQGLLDQINGSGLGHLVSSWTGGGQGQPISVDQLKSALTPEHIQEIAGALHMDPNSALAHLAEHLPMLAGNQA